MHSTFAKRGFLLIILVILIIFAVAMVGSIFANDQTIPNTSPTMTEISTTTVIISGQRLKVHLANTPTLRTNGLSGWLNLEEDEAMLFVFDQSGNYGFWMKDMNFSIDIAWFDADWRLVHLEADVSPDTYPESFGSQVVAKYVLETQAGFFATNQIKVGTTLSVLGQ